MKSFHFFVYLPLVCALFSTTSAEVHEWVVKSKGDLVCMKMKMDTVVVHPIYDIASAVPSDANITSIQDQDCPTDVAKFEATWLDKGFRWNFALWFRTTESNTYFLELFTGVVENEDGGVRRKWSYNEYSYPSAKIGDSVTCSLLVTYRTRFIDYQWQPFARASASEYGPANECDKRLPPVAVFFCVFISVLAVVCTFLLFIVVNSGS